MRKTCQNHCGHVLAHRGCIYAGPVLKTIVFCGADEHIFDSCEYADPKKVRHLNPTRVMLPAAKRFPHD